MMMEIKDVPSALLVIQRQANDNMNLQEENAVLRARLARLERQGGTSPALASPTWGERARLLVQGRVWKK